jgi:hypothetical protein
VAALFTIGKSRVIPAGLVNCPVLVVTVPVFDSFFAELDDMWLWAVTASANAGTYALVAWGVTLFVRRRSKRRPTTRHEHRVLSVRLRKESPGYFSGK